MGTPVRSYERQCAGKHVYHSKADAKRAAKMSATNGYGWMTAYKCPWCSEPGFARFHVGHPPKTRQQPSQG